MLAFISALGIGKYLLIALGVLGTLAGVWFHGKSTGVKAQSADDKAVVQNAQSDAKKVVVDSEVANQQVVDAAAQKSAQVESVINRIDSEVDALPEGEAQKQLAAKYGANS